EGVSSRRLGPGGAARRDLPAPRRQAGQHPAARQRRAAAARLRRGAERGRRRRALQLVPDADSRFRAARAIQRGRDGPVVGHLRPRRHHVRLHHRQVAAAGAEAPGTRRHRTPDHRLRRQLLLPAAARHRVVAQAQSPRTAGQHPRVHRPRLLRGRHRSRARLRPQLTLRGTIARCVPSCTPVAATEHGGGVTRTRRFMRPSQRLPDQLRPVTIQRGYTRHAEGSVLVAFGDTRVLCTASIEERTPPFLRGKGSGWVTAEYGMLPRSTNTRMPREAARGRQGGRTLEIQRLIGRSLRAVTDLRALGERTVTLDCDVIQADGGTRTAAITGSWVALHDALNVLVAQGAIEHLPLTGQVASVSVGIYGETPVLDLDYAEDSTAET